VPIYRPTTLTYGEILERSNVLDGKAASFLVKREKKDKNAISRYFGVVMTIQR